MKRFDIWMLCVLLWLAGPLSAAGTAVLRGTVKLADGSAIPGVTITLKGDQGTRSATTNSAGEYVFMNLSPGKYELKAELDGFKTFVQKGIKVEENQTATLEVIMETCSIKEEIVVCARSTSRWDQVSMTPGLMMDRTCIGGAAKEWNTEEYGRRVENTFRSVLQEPLSTFSIDVDTASYSNARRFLLQNNALPPRDAVRIEEWINYFSYRYPQPAGDDPFTVNHELTICPWDSEHRLLLIGLQGKQPHLEQLPPNNLVFLLDVSGSMSDEDKLPLVKQAFRLLVEQLRPQDRVAIAVYAGAAGLVLPSTTGDKKAEILAALERLEAGGCTAGGEGIRLAYEIAAQNYRPEANNRVILATDGDFNIGVSSTGEMVRLVEARRDSGIFLTVLGFGEGNLKDERMEQIADKGNGQYRYIDGFAEAQNVFRYGLTGTLFTIAKDVKIQVEFNPAQVKAYRLVGYENRLLNAEDFNDDRKDAGEMGAGHSVTALYELIPADSREKVPGVDDLKYQQRKIAARAIDEGETATVKVRYKSPKQGKSRKLEFLVNTPANSMEKASENLRWACAVAQFGMLLSDSAHKGRTTFAATKTLAEGAVGDDPRGSRREFLTLLEQARLLTQAEPQK